MSGIKTVRLTCKNKTIEVGGTPDQIKEQKALLGAMMSRGRGYAEVSETPVNESFPKVKHL